VVNVPQIDLAGKLGDARERVDAEMPAEERGLAKFARLTRKDTRIRADQDAALTALAKTVMRRRTVKAERITENTLIRIAIDLLFVHAELLRGSTEEELRNSLSSGLPTSQTSDVADSGTFEAPGSGSYAIADARTSGAAGTPTGEVQESSSSEVRDVRTPNLSASRGTVRVVDPWRRDGAAGTGAVVAAPVGFMGMHVAGWGLGR
jgi:hypothetical protein